jgi:predicted Fe-Mo cluster-binding NifX family protein
MIETTEYRRRSRMKVVVTSIGEGMDSQVDPRFGRASTFVLIDTETGETQSIDNSDGAGAAQGAGIQAAEAVSRLGAECLITGHCGPKAFRALQAAGIEVYTGASGTIAEAIGQLKSGGLQLSTGPDVGGHW